MFLLCLQARRQVGLLLRTRGTIETFKALFDISGFPHSDTLDHGFSRLSPQDMQEVVSGMLRKLIVKKISRFFSSLRQILRGCRRWNRNAEFPQTPLRPLPYPQAQRKNALLPYRFGDEAGYFKWSCAFIDDPIRGEFAPNSLGEQLGLGLIWIRNEIRFVISFQALPNTKTPLPITLRLHKLTGHILKNRVPHKGVAKARLKLPPKVQDCRSKANWYPPIKWNPGKHITNVNSFGISV